MMNFGGPPQPRSQPLAAPPPPPPPPAPASAHPAGSFGISAHERNALERVYEHLQELGDDVHPHNYSTADGVVSAITRANAIMRRAMMKHTAQSAMTNNYTYASLQPTRGFFDGSAAWPACTLAHQQQWTNQTDGKSGTIELDAYCESLKRLRARLVSMSRLKGVQPPCHLVFGRHLHWAAERTVHLCFPSAFRTETQCILVCCQRRAMPRDLALMLVKWLAVLYAEFIIC